MYNHILVPIALGHGDVGDRILRVAKFLAADKGRLTLLTVLETIPGYVGVHIPQSVIHEREGEARERMLAMARAAGVEAKALLAYGDPSREILDCAAKHGCDAIIIGAHKPDYRDFLIGSTAARVVRHAQCTVVVERSTPAP